MKIAIISTPFVRVPPRDYGGTELVMCELAEGLVERGHDVTLFATGDSETSARLEALFPESCWPPDALTDLNHVSWAARRIADAGDYDLVHAQSAASLALARLLPDTPIVYTLHHVREEMFSRYYPFFPEVWYVAISGRQCELEVPLPRLATIPHGLDPAKYGGPSEAGDHVCFLGRLTRIKGPHVAMDVAERAGVEIRVAGGIHDDDAQYPGFGEREIEPRLRRPHVNYLGSVGMDRKVPLLLGASALLMPLAWEEPFGLVMLEAMLCGCPVVAFPRGSAPELIDDGTTGFLVPDADAMVEVIRSRLPGFDRERCRRIAAAKFSRDRMVERYEAYYDRALRESPRPRPRLLRASA